MVLGRSNVLKIEDYRPTFISAEKVWSPSDLPKSHYLKTILEISQKYLEQELSAVGLIQSRKDI